MQGAVAVILSRVVRVGFLKTGPSKKRLGRSERMSHVGIWGKGSLRKQLLQRPYVERAWAAWRFTVGSWGRVGKRRGGQRRGRGRARVMWACVKTLAFPLK